MSTLHVINKSETDRWHLLLAALSDGDAILLIEDAVFIALPGWETQFTIWQFQEKVPIFALASDLVLRGISARIRPQVAQASYADFVEMSLWHQRVVNW